MPVQLWGAADRQLAQSARGWSSLQRSEDTTYPPLPVRSIIWKHWTFASVCFCPELWRPVQTRVHSRLSFSREFLQFSIQCGPGWSLIPAGNNVKGFLCTALQVAFLGPGNPTPFDAWYNNVIRWSPDYKATLFIILSQHHERWKTTVTGGHCWPIHMNKSSIICTNYSRYLSLWLDP